MLVLARGAELNRLDGSVFVHLERLHHREGLGEVNQVLEVVVAVAAADVSKLDHAVGAVVAVTAKGFADGGGRDPRVEGGAFLR